MPTREEELRRLTFKGDVEEGDVERRVFYTLQQDKNLQAHRNSKAIACLVKLLMDKDLIDDEELDALLLEAAR